jgi:ATP-dependent Clp protease ATP-binding subunit ClpA
MIDEKLEKVFSRAIRFVNEKRHEFVSQEIVFYFMLDDQLLQNVLEICGANLEELRSELKNFIEDDSNFSILTEAEITELNKIQFSTPELKEMAENNGIYYQPELSSSLSRILQRAVIHVKSSGKSKVNSINMLVSAFLEKNCFMIKLLEKQNVTKTVLINAIAHGIDAPVNSTEDDSKESTIKYKISGNAEELGSIKSSAQNNISNEEKERNNKSKHEKALEDFTENITEKFKKGLYDPVIGRENEIQRIYQTLCRKTKNNPLLVGEPGVGKTALVIGLASTLAKNKEENSKFNHAQIYSLDMALLLAGAKFRGEFEERLNLIVEAITQKNRNGINAILFIDEIHNVIGAGATSSGSLDASNLLRPSLSMGQIYCIGATTFKEYRKFVEKDQAFLRRFQKIEVNEPTPDETFAILKGIVKKYEDHHKVIFSEKILHLIIDLSQKYLNEKKFPDKAIDVLDEIGSYIQIKNLKKKLDNNYTPIRTHHVEHIISQLGKVPHKSVNTSEKRKLQNLENDLKSLIFGQDEAVEKVTSAIMLGRLGLGHTSKPIASFMFAGPTGVGKTELAKQLAFCLGVHFERVDMSEYMEKHAVSKLIGAPPGYIGHDQGGKLTDAISQYPFSVLLLDEIEKAHPEILNILLQVMDYGKLTDSNGKVCDFKNVILIMTTNAGAQELETKSIQIGTNVNLLGESRRNKVLKNLFSPEFRNRLDAIIHFNKLDLLYFEKIVEKFLLEFQIQLLEKKVYLEFEQEIVQWLAKFGLEEKMGARPLSRIINEKIKKPLSKEILCGSLEKGGKVNLRLKDDSRKNLEINTSFKMNSLNQSHKIQNEVLKKNENSDDKKKLKSSKTKKDLKIEVDSDLVFEYSH